jgi:hypothetical protein
LQTVIWGYGRRWENFTLRGKSNDAGTIRSETFSMAFPNGYVPRRRNNSKKIPYAETLAECERLRDMFVDRYRKDYSKAAEKLLADWDRMVTFYSFPKEHWSHIRTTCQG